MVARLEEAHHRGEDRRHAGRRRHARLRPLEGGQAILEHRDRRIREARVDEAFVRLGEARGLLFRAAEGKARRQEQRFGMLVELRPPLARPYTQCCAFSHKKTRLR